MGPDDDRHAGRGFRVPNVKGALEQLEKETSSLHCFELTMAVLEGKKYIVTGQFIVHSY